MVTLFRHFWIIVYIFLKCPTLTTATADNPVKILCSSKGGHNHRSWSEGLDHYWLVNLLVQLSSKSAFTIFSVQTTSVWSSAKTCLMLMHQSKIKCQCHITAIGTWVTWQESLHKPVDSLKNPLRNIKTGYYWLDWFCILRWNRRGVANAMKDSGSNQTAEQAIFFLVFD